MSTNRDGGGFRPVRFGLMILTLTLLLGRRTPDVVESATDTLALAEDEVAGPSFARVVARNYAAWDLNHDGWIEADEVDRLMGDPDIVGDDAAALATIKLRGRELSKSKEPTYTAWLRSLSAANAAPVGPTSLRGAIAGFADSLACESSFHRFRRINDRFPGRLFARGEPDFEPLRQGDVGDCFFFSVTGAMVKRDPARVTSMIRPEPDGSWTVRFPAGAVPVPRLSQAEALANNTGSTLDDGYWIVVLEMAVAEYLRHYDEARRTSADPFDEIADGGHSWKVIELYTGHYARKLHFGDIADEGPRAAELRRILLETLGGGRMAAISMDEAPAGTRKVPGLGYDHAYAVLGFDPADDVVTLWNPWGVDFDPAGAEGVEHGFPTRHGIFRLPLPMLGRLFSSIQYETDDRVL